MYYTLSKPDFQLIQAQVFRTDTIERGNVSHENIIGAREVGGSINGCQLGWCLHDTNDGLIPFGIPANLTERRFAKIPAAVAMTNMLDSLFQGTSEMDRTFPVPFKQMVSAADGRFWTDSWQALKCLDQLFQQWAGSISGHGVSIRRICMINSWCLAE